MRARDALDLLERLADGRLKAGRTYAWTHSAMSPPERARMDPVQELEAWGLYRRFAAGVEPQARFNSDGVANGHEQRRRRVLMGMFFLIELRSQDAGVRALFKGSVGELSLREIMTFCGTRVPHFYYEWAFDALPASKQSFGPDSLKHVALSPDHRRTFVKLDADKRDLLAVRKVMES